MTPGTASGAAAALQPAVAALEAEGADRFNPVRFRYIKAMASRSLQLDAAAADIVTSKALAALRQYQLELSRERAETATLVKRVSTERPASAECIRTLFEACDFRAVRRMAAGLRRVPAGEGLADLIPRLNRARQSAEREPGSDPGAELRATRYFRDVLQQRHADALVSRALLEAPEDSGPLNPQKLAIRSLAAMRDISPRYLARFVAYVDTLFWLEKAGENHKP
jgi:hypothetical protein